MRRQGRDRKHLDLDIDTAERGTSMREASWLPSRGPSLIWS
jgi:hypothetical protein